MSQQVTAAPPAPISKRKKFLLHFLAADLGMFVLKSSCYGNITWLACLGEGSTHSKALTFGDRQGELGLSGEIFPSLPFPSSDKVMEEAFKRKESTENPGGTFL